MGEVSSPSVCHESVIELVTSLFDVQYTGDGVEPNADAPGTFGGIYDPIKEF